MNILCSFIQLYCDCFFLCYHDAGECSGWKIGCGVAIVLLGLLGLALAVWKIRSHCTSQPIVVDGGPEVTTYNAGKNCDSKTTDDDVPMLKF